MQMKVVIVGCGRVGARIATVLDKQDHDVSIIDLDSSAFRRLEPDFNGRAVAGTGIDEDVLRAAGISEADAFIAVTNGDNRNLMAAQIAKVIFGVERVAARVYDPDRAETFKAMGVDTICSTLIMSNLIVDSVMQTENSGKA
jgi:trk system potassium uptake protein